MEGEDFHRASLATKGGTLAPFVEAGGSSQCEWPMGDLSHIWYVYLILWLLLITLIVTSMIVSVIIFTITIVLSIWFFLYHYDY